MTDHQFCADEIERQNAELAAQSRRIAALEAALNVAASAIAIATPRMGVDWDAIREVTEAQRKVVGALQGSTAALDAMLVAARAEERERVCKEFMEYAATHDAIHAAAAIRRGE